ncbi:MAG: NAD-dependent deacylase [Ignavibacteria bacterium]|nr:NAD-dependent deacylase [Ignavibacteria bacterium]
MNIKFSERLLSRLAAADAVVAFTGAGVSAESGVPTFRGTDGIWAKFKPEELANVDAFMRNPALVWEWYAARKKIIAAITPNAGHYALVQLERLFSSFAVITQNIDNLHRRAGSSRVYELHGNIERNYCMKCGVDYSNADILSMTEVPVCSRCGGLVRPDVVWFGELLPEEEWNHSVRAVESADVMLSIGTSSVVHPAAGLPILAKHSGAFLVEINPERTLLTENVDEFLKGTSAVILPLLLEQLVALEKQDHLAREKTKKS